MRIDTLSTFPHMYDSVMEASMMRIARERGILDFHAHDLRDWTHDRHRTTDDYPYGGGCGLLMKCEPIFEAVEAIMELEPGTLPLTLPLQTPAHAQHAHPDAQSRSNAVATPAASLAPNSASSSQNYKVAPGCKVIFMSPHGRRFTDALAKELATEDRLLFVCGHYEGIDERVYTLADEMISLGDYVLTSGELASMVIIDAVVRKLPGVLGAKRGADEESFANELLEHPQYTRPSDFRGMCVPDVLLSGHHAKIAEWQRRMSLRSTLEKRPDMLEAFLESDDVTASDCDYLKKLLDN